MEFDKFKKKPLDWDEFVKISRKDNKLQEQKKVTWLTSVDDRVDHPSHYTNGSQEAIVTIEEAIDGAPSVQTGMLQAQVLKYLLRVWYKDNPLEDLKKAQWYLKRLIEKLQ